VRARGEGEDRQDIADRAPQVSTLQISPGEVHPPQICVLQVAVMEVQALEGGAPGSMTASDNDGVGKREPEILVRPRDWRVYPLWESRGDRRPLGARASVLVPRRCGLGRVKYWRGGVDLRGENAAVRTVVWDGKSPGGIGRMVGGSGSGVAPAEVIRQ
jgi:hypothetical protein